MKSAEWNRIVFFGAAMTCLIPAAAFAQGDIVKSEGIRTTLHQANIGKIVFVAKPRSVDSLGADDFLKTFTLTPARPLTMRAFMGNSLTNYLHRLAPQLSADELNAQGNYQMTFYVDDKLVDQENLHPGTVSAENKNTKTVFIATIVDATTPDDPWGTIWQWFRLQGGDHALSPGTHRLRIELRPYLQTSPLTVGDLIASGELQLVVPKSAIDAKATAIRTIEPGSGWPISKDSYDRRAISELKRKIAEGLYKQITSLVVIKKGELLIEEYFNGASRATLHNTRSVGKSFTSTIMGIAINEGYIKDETRTLGEFYNLKDFPNYSPKKESVTLRSLLTMSSGFNGNDDDEESPGNEEKMYPTADWVRFALGVPMDEKTAVGEKWRYFTAGVVVLGDIIHKSVPGGMERYADQKLFRPLGITKYQWQYTPQKVVNTAGGLQMRSIDYAKYGQLYMNGGRWNGKQIVPRAWVDKTFTRQVRRGPGEDEYYGYLFWYGLLNNKGRKHKVFFATGNGGSKIYVFQDQPLVIVITATAYGQSYMHRQATSMMEQYILPALIK